MMTPAQAERSQGLVDIIELISTKVHSPKVRFPGVYIVWNGDRALYVGSSCNVLTRARRNKHEQRGRNQAFALRTKIEIYPCDSLRQARHLEVELIGVYNPPYNKLDHYQSSRSIERLKAEHSKLFAEVA